MVGDGAGAGWHRAHNLFCNASLCLAPCACAQALEAALQGPAFQEVADKVRAADACARTVEAHRSALHPIHANGPLCPAPSCTRLQLLGLMDLTSEHAAPMAAAAAAVTML